MSLSNIIKGILNLQKKINLTELPSQGLFYKDDFELSIKKANIEDIIEYEYNYEKDDLGLVITRIKKIVEKGAILSKNYSFSDIKSIDVVFLFLEIVKFTNGNPVLLTYFNDIKGYEESISFDASNFNYFKLNKNIMSKYDSESKEFIIDGFRYSAPSIGAENCLTQFLISKSNDPNAIKYNNYSYDFLYFLGHKKNITFDEIENLIQIFNFDIQDNELKSIKKITKELSVISRYSLIRDSKIIDVSAKIDLQKIWK